MRKLLTKLKKIKNQRGISMPEIMAGITIMTILAGTGVASAVNQINKAKLASTMDEMKAISQALAHYHADYPGGTISTITTLVSEGYLSEGFTDAPDTDLETDWKEDAWGNDYRLVKPFVDVDGDYKRGSLESAGSGGELLDNPDTADYDESDDNIKITIEPMIASD